MSDKQTVYNVITDSLSEFSQSWSNSRKKSTCKLFSCYMFLFLIYIYVFFFLIFWGGLPGS